MRDSHRKTNMATPNTDQVDPLTATADGPSPARRDIRLGLYFVIAVTILAGSAAPTPLYEHYASQWGGSALTTTAAFAIYAFGVLGGLLVFGQASEHLGRKPVVVAGMVVQSIALVVLTTAGDYSAVFAARILQGVAVGATLGALGAGMVDGNRDRGPIASTSSSGMGTAVGALGAGLAVSFLPWPGHLSYIALIAAGLLQIMVLLATPDRPASAQWTVSSLIPTIAVPRSVRKRFAATAPVCFGAWALPGFYSSLSPRVVADLTGNEQPFLGGAVLAALTAVGSAVAVLLRRVRPAYTMWVGVTAMLVTGAILFRAGASESMAWYLLGTVTGGIAFGAGLQGGTRYVLEKSDPDRNAGLISAVWIAAYLGNGIPVIACGYFAASGTALFSVLAGFGVGLAGIALYAACALLWASTSDAHTSPETAQHASPERTTTDKDTR